MAMELSAALPQLGVYPLLPTVPVTTGASPQSYDGTPAVVAITTGGTAGDEIIDLQLPELPAAGFANPYIVGQRIIFTLVAQTDPSDNVVITVNGSQNIPFYSDLTNAALQSDRGTDEGAGLNFEGATVSFVWATDNWYIEYAATDGLFNTSSPPHEVSLQGGAGLAAKVHGGNGYSGSPAGGVVELQAGDAHSGDTGDGGDIFLKTGTLAGAGRDGLVVIGGAGLPTADPHYPGALWNSSGVVHVSAG